jgi:hypothetical protein
MSFTAADLRDRGFEGFVPVSGLADKKPHQVPLESGVYAVVREATSGPVFLETSGASWFKRQDPTVATSKLQEKWVDDAPTLYIGKAVTLQGRVGLLVEFSRAGRHRSVFHKGGRYLWQIEGNQDLLVAWTREPLFEGYENKLLEEFIETYGRMPFANLKLDGVGAERPDRR